MSQWGSQQDQLNGLPESAAGGGAGEVAREVRAQAKTVGASARERAIRLADDRRGGLAEGLRHIADRLEEVAHEPESGKQLEPVLGQIAGVTRKVADALHDKPANELFDMAKRAARERPALVVAGCFALGFFGARLLRE